MEKTEIGPRRVTHEVFNQPPPLQDYNVFEQDRVLADALQREGGDWAQDRARTIGAIAGGAAIEWGIDANRNPPELRTHDRYGNRIDEIAFHPSWHRLLGTAVEHGLHALPWREPRAGSQVARAAMFFVYSQAEAGNGCPISMTFSAIPALRQQPEIAAEWEPRLTSTEYDPRMIPPAQKTGALCGMAMTEKQGGSDVRENTTRARPMGSGGPGAEYEVTGHKWFCSAPMSDAFLVLAQTERGVSCFLLPRWLPDGTRNRFQIQRLKDKLGNRSNASSEVEFDGAWARLIGQDGRGVPTIIEMVNHTRLDCVIGAAAMMRHAVAQATHHCAHRAAFGKPLIEQPLMKNVLADLCIESEAATVSMMRLARAYDEARDDDRQRHFARLATAVVKYWVCKRTPPQVAEALECLGGAGYVEESPMPRIYREAPLNSIWEGSGNVMCLDVLRAIGRSPEGTEAFLDEMALAGNVNPHFDRFLEMIRKGLSDVDGIETRARTFVEQLALAFQASLLLRYSEPAVAETFCASRLGGDHGYAFGTLPRGVEFDKIIDRARPVIDS
jgi:putative acyl-CoA dehydrogenase